MWSVEAVRGFSLVACYQSLIRLHSRPYKANPDYKGKWYAPMIDNPAYKGEWAPRKIPNPAWFEDLTPVRSLAKIVRRPPYVYCSMIDLAQRRAVSALSYGP